MKTFEILKVTIKKRVFVVPLDLQCNESTALKLANMINFMGDRFPFLAINGLLDCEVDFVPILCCE